MNVNIAKNNLILKKLGGENKMKNWKKIDGIEWKNTKTKDSVLVFPFVNRLKNKKYVFSFNEYETVSTVQKTFKTKTLAIKYAKDFMKKNDD